jgi:hypothetical protein
MSKLPARAHARRSDSTELGCARPRSRALTGRCLISLMSAWGSSAAGCTRHADANFGPVAAQSSDAGHAAPAANSNMDAGPHRGGSGASGAGSAANGGEIDLQNPSPGSALFFGANFWNIDYEGSDNYFSSDVNWDTAQNPWKPALLGDLGPYRVLRFADWNLIDEADNPQATWNMRSRKTERPSEPVAYEWQIDLCNRTKKDYWVNIPHAANGDYVRQLAELIHDQLDPSLRVYVEWSNELWNGGLPQRAYAQAAAANLGLSGGDGAIAYQVYQSVRTFEAFTVVFGGGPQIVRVLSGQADSAETCQTQLQALADPMINPNGTQPDVYAIAPYFAGRSSAELQADIPRAAQGVSDNRQCASAAGLPVVAYAGGADSSAAGADCATLQQDPALRTVYSDYLDALNDAALRGPFAHYTHSGPCWGLKASVGDTRDAAPKYQAIVDWAAAHP